MKEFTIEEFAHFLGAELAEHRLHKAQAAGIEVAAQMIADEAKRALGTYDYGWKQLAESTQRSREHLGFEPNEPGIRTGAMRDSIEVTVISPHEAEVGSDDDHMVYFELGTETQPPRPTLAAAAAVKGRAAAKMIGEIVGEAVAGASIDSAIAKLALKAVTDLGHTAHELVEAGEEDESERR